MSCPAHDLAKSRKMLVKEDVDLIQEAVSRLSEIEQLRVVELGTGSGTSALAVLCARPENVKIISIDNNDEGDWGELAVSNIGRAGDFRLVKGESSERWQGTADESIDLLIMDASHKADALRDEFKAWLLAVKMNGWIWVHDYGDPKEFGLPVEMARGVKRTVDAMVNKGELEEVKVAGLGWLGRRSDPKAVAESQIDPSEEPTPEPEKESENGPIQSKAPTKSSKSYSSKN